MKDNLYFLAAGLNVAGAILVTNTVVIAAFSCLAVVMFGLGLSYAVKEIK